AEPAGPSVGSATASGGLAADPLAAPVRSGALAGDPATSAGALGSSRDMPLGPGEVGVPLAAAPAGSASGAVRLGAAVASGDEARGAVASSLRTAASPAAGHLVACWRAGVDG